MVMGVHAITAGLTVLDTHYWEWETVAHTLANGTAPTAEEAVGHAKYFMGVHCTEQPECGKHGRKSWMGN